MGTTSHTTLPACLTQAGLVGASVALPDYISSRTGCSLTQLALAPGGGVLGVLTAVLVFALNRKQVRP